MEAPADSLPTHGNTGTAVANLPDSAPPRPVPDGRSFSGSCPEILPAAPKKGAAPDPPAKF